MINLKSFEACLKATGIANTHAKKIEEGLGAFGKIEKAMFGKGSYATVGKEASSFNDLNQGLNRTLSKIRH